MGFAAVEPLESVAGVTAAVVSSTLDQLVAAVAVHASSDVWI